MDLYRLPPHRFVFDIVHLKRAVSLTRCNPKAFYKLLRHILLHYTSLIVVAFGLRETCKGGQFSCVLAANVSSNLKPKTIWSECVSGPIHNCPWVILGETMVFVGHVAQSALIKRKLIPTDETEPLSLYMPIKSEWFYNSTSCKIISTVSEMHITGLPESLPNAHLNCGIDPNVGLISLGNYTSASFWQRVAPTAPFKDWYFRDQHWALIEGVLI